MKKLFFLALVILVFLLPLSIGDKTTLLDMLKKTGTSIFILWLVLKHSDEEWAIMIALIECVLLLVGFGTVVFWPQETFLVKNYNAINWTAFALECAILLWYLRHEVISYRHYLNRDSDRLVANPESHS